MRSAQYEKQYANTKMASVITQDKKDENKTHKRIGYIYGTFDMFSIHHLKGLEYAKEHCDYLIVGVIFNEASNDKGLIIPYAERFAIVDSIIYVDKTVPHDCRNFDQLVNAVQRDNVNVIFVKNTLEKKEVLGILKNCFADIECLVIEIPNEHINVDLLRNDYQLSLEGKKIGYTTGVFDMFHIGHLNILRRARELCDYLIVGVSTDELVMDYKNKTPIVPFNERKEIIKAVKYVDLVVPQINMNKFEAWKKIKFNILFHGDDWKGSSMYQDIEEKLSCVGCKVFFLPHTDGISSTILREKIDANC